MNVEHAQKEGGLRCGGLGRKRLGVSFRVWAINHAMRLNGQTGSERERAREREREEGEQERAEQERAEQERAEQEREREQSKREQSKREGGEFAKEERGREHCVCVYVWAGIRVLRVACCVLRVRVCGCAGVRVCGCACRPSPSAAVLSPAD